ncbi:hypothetical protein THRCLA_22250 [Thraustotheca clavata]|uniref:DDE Tnp4 domain-containing protein n=1 Tax=Thraustotheca clavata TaxID=74557 RepID=A0A1V9Z8C1_9STRA|nr:hypothetical protein THRCLA_22250 [Thraustotheca clavata]
MLAIMLQQYTTYDVVTIVSTILARCNGEFNTFLTAMEVMLVSGVVRLRPERLLINASNSIDLNMDDSTALHKFRFTIPQLRLIVVKLKMPEIVIVLSNDHIIAIEAHAMVCRRLGECCRLFTIANEFGRSMEACSRTITSTIRLIYIMERRNIYENKFFEMKAVIYANAIRTKSGLEGLKNCIAFVDGTKQYISRPLRRQNAPPNEDLQRSVYNGHPRRHCMNWQGITTPDDFIISMFGPVEGRRHDATMLSLSGILDKMENNLILIFLH